MNLNTQEIYEKFYMATADRFYKPQQLKRLLSLFAAAYGIVDGSREYAALLGTVSGVERLGVESVADCKNFLLIADSIPGKRELVRAVKAKLEALEAHARQRKQPYTDLVDWRSRVYRSAAADVAAKLEVGYIEYAAGKVEGAIRRFEEVLNASSSLTVVEHLAIIHLELGNYESALYYLLLYESVLEGVLNVECDGAIKGYIGAARARVSESVAADAAVRAEKKRKSGFSWGGNGKGVIGF